MTKTCLKSLHTQMLNVTMFHHLNTNRWDLHINQPRGESCIKHVCCISPMNFYRSDFKHKIYVKIRYLKQAENPRKQPAILTLGQYMCICTPSRTDSKMTIIGGDFFRRMPNLNKPLPVKCIFLTINITDI